MEESTGPMGSLREKPSSVRYSNGSLVVTLPEGECHVSLEALDDLRKYHGMATVDVVRYMVRQIMGD